MKTPRSKVAGLTIAGKIWLTFGIVTSVGVAAMLVIFAALTSVRGELTDVAENGEPLSAASYELEINMFEVASAVFRYLDTRQPEARSLVAKNIREFESFHASFMAVADGSAERRAGSQLGREFREFATLGRGLLDERDRTHRLTSRTLSTIDLIEVVPGIELLGTDGRSTLLMLQRLLLDANDASTPTPEAAIKEVRAALRVGARELRRRGIDPGVSALYLELRADFRDVTEALANTESALNRFISLRTSMDRVLDEQIQTAAAAQLSASRSRADDAANRSLALFALLLPVFILLGAIAAALIVRSIKSSVGALTAGAGAIAEGDLAHRVETETQDELAGLASEFNRMASQLGVTQERLQYLAHYDLLTGLANRALFLERLEGAIARVARGAGPVALLYLDLDGFKGVNDDMGHESGDLLLKLVAERLRDSVRQVDTVSRLGGDEFVVILESFGVESQAQSVAKNLLRRLTEPFILVDQEATIGASIGVAICPEDATNVDELVRKADTAMYAAKAAGRGTVRRYQASLERATPDARRHLRIAEND